MKGQFNRLAIVAAMFAALAPAAGKAQSMEKRGGRLTPYGEYFLIGGGVTNYVEGAVKDRLDIGGTWDVRAGFGSRYFVGAEIAYVGGAQKAGDLGSNLISNGAEAVLRVQFPYEQGRWLVEPFAFGGGGWTHFSLGNNAPGLTLRDSDDVFHIPFGAGVTLGYDRYLMDARFTYRQTFNEKLIRAYNGSDANLSSWAITASVGYEF